MRTTHAAHVLGAMILVLAAAVMLAACTAGPDAASKDRPYYEGKSITILVPFAEGGGTDVWARFMEPYLEKYIDGQPTISIRNVAGGESITGANQFMAEAKNDGLLWLGSSGTTVYNRFLGRPEVQYDFAKLKPIMVNGTGGAIYVAPKSGVKTLKDLQNPAEPLVYGGISATGLDAVALIAFDLLKLDVKAVFGMEGRGPARLALERGETTIDYQTTPAYQSNVAPLVKDNKVVPLMSFGILDEAGKVVRDPALPDLPTVAEAYKEIHGADPSGPAWEAYRSFMPAGFSYQKALWAHGETPDGALNAVYAATDEMIADADFTAKSKEVLGGYPLYRGDKVAEAVRGAFAISPDVQNYVKELLRTKYNVQF